MACRRSLAIHTLYMPSMKLLSSDSLFFIFQKKIYHNFNANQFHVVIRKSFRCGCFFSMLVIYAQKNRYFKKITMQDRHLYSKFIWPDPILGQMHFNVKNEPRFDEYNNWMYSCSSFISSIFLKSSIFPIATQVTTLFVARFK